MPKEHYMRGMGDAPSAGGGSASSQAIQPHSPGLFFIYSFTVTLTALQSLPNQTISILDAPFKWILAAAQSTGPFTVNIRDGKNKRPFMNIPLHQNVIFGTAQHPFPILTPYTFEYRSNILVDLVDLSNASNTVWLGFIGVEVVDTVQNS
jgi:hypothetical protein